MSMNFTNNTFLYPMPFGFKGSLEFEVFNLEFKKVSEREDKLEVSGIGTYSNSNGFKELNKPTACKVVADFWGANKDIFYSKFNKYIANMEENEHSVVRIYGNFEFVALPNGKYQVKCPSVCRYEIIEYCPVCNAKVPTQVSAPMPIIR